MRGCGLFYYNGVCVSSYSKGFGIIGKILGEDHILNLPNSYMGLIFFPIMLVLGKMNLKSLECATYYSIFP